ncbi:MAG: hypothetical protein QOH14_1138 [Pseudonocardiales bacterium]|nr:hypothetical protein [Pseudonocardiales bacterium]
MTTPAPGALMAAEIAQQPEVLRQALADPAEVTDAAARIRRAAPRFVVIAARGTSDHAALYAKYLAEIRMGLAAGLASPSSLTVYGARPDLTDVLFLAVSQSGGSPDLVDSVTAARECGALTVAVTNAPSSALAAAAEVHVDVRAGVEQAVAATKTYTAELIALYLLLAGDGAAARAAGLPDAAAATLGLGTAAVAAAAARYRYTSRVVTTARGYSYPTAREAALKLMETSYLSAQAFSGADLLHGPLAMIDADVPVIAVTSAGRGGSAMIPVVDRLRESGADVLQVGAPEGLAIAPDGLAIASDGIDEELLPVLEILPLQQLACQLAINRGADPDRPRGLSKVTRTW